MAASIFLTTTTDVVGMSLFLGLSTKVDVDIHDGSGASLSQQPVWQAGQDTPVYTSQVEGVDQAIQDIVAQNLGQQTAAAGAAP